MASFSTLGSGHLPLWPPSLQKVPTKRSPLRATQQEIHAPNWKMIGYPLIKKGPKLPSALFSACCSKMSLVVWKLFGDCIFMGLLLRPRSAWDACGIADLGAKAMSRKRCVILTLQTYLLSYKVSAEHCKEGIPHCHTFCPGVSKAHSSYWKWHQNCSNTCTVF